MWKISNTLIFDKTSLAKYELAGPKGMTPDRVRAECPMADEYVIFTGDDAREVWRRLLIECKIPHDMAEAECERIWPKAPKAPADPSEKLRIIIGALNELGAFRIGKNKKGREFGFDKYTIDGNVFTVFETGLIYNEDSDDPIVFATADDLKSAILGIVGE